MRDRAALQEEQKHRFVVMLAKGCSYARIARELGVSKGTLTAWNTEMEAEIATARASEWASLTWGSFNLSDSEPSVRVLAAYSKHRRDDVLPLRADLAKQLLAWRCELDADQHAEVFPGFSPNKAAKRLRKDLAAAGIPDEDGAGRGADFHALRHTFISNLTRGGVSPKIAQSLPRHGWQHRSDDGHLYPHRFA